MPLKIGLTGGIASGKSTVCKLFEQYGIVIIDADMIAHQLVYPGSETLQAIIDEFGDSILTDDGNLDRKHMRELIFTDEDSRNRLERIMHPRILNEMSRQASTASSPYCILDIPLLVEEGLQNLVDRVLVVDVPVSIQRERLMARDDMTDEQVDRALSAQTDRSYRLSHADDVIDNSQSIPMSKAQVIELHHTYLTLATTTGDFTS